MGKSDGKRSLKTIERMTRVVELLQERGSSRVTDIANELDMTPATVHNYLSTLEQNRFVVKDGEKYRLGLRFLTIGGHIRNQYEVYSLVEPKVTQIAEQTDERTQFLVEEHGQGIVLCKEMSPNAVVANTVVGKTSYLHASAAGKAILAETEDDRVAKIIDQWGLPKHTENTLVTRENFYQELSEIRNQGYAFNDEESIEGLRAVGVPVVTSDGKVLGGLSVSGPANRMRDDWYRDEIPHILLGAANEIQLKSTYG